MENSRLFIQRFWEVFENILKNFYFFFHFGRSALDSVLWNDSSVRPSVHPSLNFLKIESLVFSGIVHDDSWPWLSSDWQSQISEEKKIGGPTLGATCQNYAQNEVFLQYLEFGLYAFLEIACNDSLRQCLTSGRGNPPPRPTPKKEKKWEPKFGLNGPKSDLKLAFLLFSQVWFTSFPLNYIGWQLI